MIIKLSSEDMKKIMPEIIDDTAKNIIREGIDKSIKKAMNLEFNAKVEQRLNNINIYNEIKNIINQKIDKIISYNFCDNKFHISDYNLKISNKEKENIRNIMADKIINKIPLKKLKEIALKEIKESIIKSKLVE